MLALALLSAAAQGSDGESDAEFDPGFFTGAALTKADLSRFSHPNVVLPGKYRTDLLVNGEKKQTEDIIFVQDHDGAGSHPCLSDSLLRTLGLSNELVAGSENGDEGRDQCAPVASRFEGVVATFDVANQSLDLTIPQGLLERRPRGYVDPALWDYGVNAALFGYRFNNYVNQTSSGTAGNSYLAVDAGLNLGKWRFRHSSSVSFADSGSNFNSIRAFVQRDLKAIKSQLSVGDTYTDGRQMDSYRIRGFSLSTDDRMSPDSQTGYAPVVQGVAETNARVVVSQRGTELYQISVAPGPFVIDDLYATGYGGDLLVEIHEADGRVRTFNVPYSATPNILRKGQARYALSGGQFNEESAGFHPWVIQGTYARGLTNTMTGYVGASAAERYNSVQVGTAFNTAAGAVSLDVTSARTRLTEIERRSGRSIQMRYSKNFAKQGTTFAIGAYRYSTDGFLGLADSIRLREAIAAGYGKDALDRIRSRFDMTLNQSLGQRGGSLYANASAQSYWNSRRDSKSYSIGYSNYFGAMTIGLSAQRSMIAKAAGAADRDTVYQLNVSMPLGSKPRTPILTASVVNASSRGSDGRLALNGSLGEDGQLHYNLAGSASTRDSEQISAGLDYLTPVGQLSAGGSIGTGYRTLNMGVSGGVVAHPKGITFSQSLGDTIAVVEAQGAVGAKVANATGVRIDRQGFAVVPYLSPYSKNSVDLGTIGATLDVEFEETSKTVVPTLGSVIMVDYESKAGEAMLIEIADQSGAPLPFGADVVNQDGALVSVIGQASTIFVNRAPSDYRYQVEWGGGDRQRCDFTLPSATSRPAGALYTRLRIVCSQQAHHDGSGPDLAATR